MNRFELARLNEHIRGRIKISDQVMHPAFLAIDSSKLRKQTLLLLGDLCKVVFLGQKQNASRLGACAMRTFWFRIPVS